MAARRFLGPAVKPTVGEIGRQKRVPMPRPKALGCAKLRAHFSPPG
jgi:hypothetical protein